MTPEDSKVLSPVGTLVASVCDFYVIYSFLCCDELAIAAVEEAASSGPQL